MSSSSSDPCRPCRVDGVPCEATRPLTVVSGEIAEGLTASRVYFCDGGAPRSPLRPKALIIDSHHALPIQSPRSTRSVVCLFKAGFSITVDLEKPSQCRYTGRGLGHLESAPIILHEDLLRTLTIASRNDTGAGCYIRTHNKSWYATDHFTVFQHTKCTSAFPEKSVKFPLLPHLRYFEGN